MLYCHRDGHCRGNLGVAGALSLVVALMGASLSDEQEGLFLRALGPDGRLALLLDGDETGRAAATEIAARLVERLYIKVIRLADDQQPSGLSEANIRAIMGI